MNCALTGDLARLRPLVTKATGVESRRAAGGPGVRISDDMGLIEAWLTTSPLMQRALLRSLVRGKPDLPVRREARQALRESPAPEIRRLRAENYYNAFAGLFNWGARLGGNVLTLNTGNVAQSIIDLLFLWQPFVELTPQDRAAIAICDEWRKEIARSGADDPGPRIERLRRRLRQRNAEEENLCGEWYLRKGQWEAALMAFGRAEGIEPGSRAAQAGRVAALRGASADYRAQQRSLEMNPEASAVGRRWAGRGLFAPRTAGWDAAGRLRTANLRRARARWAYVFLGKREEPDFPAIAPGRRERVHAVLSSFGAVVPLEWIRRGVACAIGNPAGDSAWRSAAVQYLEESGAASRESKRVAAQLARSYERLGWFDAARRYGALAFGDDPRRAQRLDKKAANQLRETAEGEQNPERRRALLAETARRFPRTNAAAKARKRLAQLAGGNYDLCRVGKAELRSWPDLWLGRGLRFPVAWFDGHAANGEISDDGVRFRAPDGATVQFALRIGGRKERREIRLAGDQRGETDRALRAWQRESEARRRAEATLDRPAFLLALEGSAGPTGFEIFPQLLPITFDPDKLPLYRSPLGAEN
jgi:hypothetical protein